MAPLNDPNRLFAYTDALSNWGFDGYIQFQLTEQAYRWIRRELENIELKEIGRQMHEHVAGGGVIEEIRETRPEWSGEHEFHYDMRLTIQDRPVYIESRLRYRVPIVADESSILVVNVHAP